MQVSVCPEPPALLVAIGTAFGLVLLDIVVVSGTKPPAWPPSMARGRGLQAPCRLPSARLALEATADRVWEMKSRATANGRCSRDGPTIRKANRTHPYAWARAARVRTTAPRCAGSAPVAAGAPLTGSSPAPAPCPRRPARAHRPGAAPRARTPPGARRCTRIARSRSHRSSPTSA
jgi:hypothetical protein